MNKDHYKILESLLNIKKHNSNKKNMRQTFQIAKFNKSDVDFLEGKNYIRITLLTKEYIITSDGEYILGHRL